uniref:p-granule-associated novel protein 1 (inferred by orthology to a C. elegans protein) n=1 Tax=Anisakis simplex TaxID=6269 RepID=A0A0M3JWF3_ANISI
LKHPSLSDNHSDKIWIGCTRQKMPQVFSALNALNETLISKLYIWDSLINIIPADMFAQVRPRQLSIEHSGVSVFRAGAFSNIGQRLKILQLRNNIIKRIEPVIVEDLHRLQVLDLGANKIAQVTKGQVDKLKDLETLILSDNQISYIEDDAFQTLTNLKTLSLADNKLTDISKNTFRGLNNLETLNLHGNTITTVDWSAFAHMKNLKLLDIGNNQITNVELHGLQSLEKLFINNNSIQTLKNISLRDLVNLNVLSLDRNSITQIQDGDLHSLAESVRLNSLSIAANKINKIESRALEPIHQLKILSLENNQLKSLSADDGIGNVSFLRPLRKLKTLLLSSNNIKQIDENDLASLVSLKTLALDHNEIEKIDSKALLRLPLTRIYLNHNRLFYLSKGTFDSLSTSNLDVVDISDNVWQCICENDWLSKWLSEVGDKNVADGSLGCIATKKMCNGDDSDDNIESEDEEHSVWITVIASILAVVSLFILIAIAFLYVEDGKRLDRITTPLRRVPSDLLRLIPDGDSIISLPSESIVEPFITSQLPPPKRSIITNHRNNASNNPLIITTHNDNSNQLSTINTNDTNDSNNNNNNGKTIEKKRVRFNGI